jgi:hypothetical protein
LRYDAAFAPSEIPLAPQNPDMSTQTTFGEKFMPGFLDCPGHDGLPDIQDSILMVDSTVPDLVTLLHGVIVWGGSRMRDFLVRQIEYGVL